MARAAAAKDGKNDGGKAGGKRPARPPRRARVSAKELEARRALEDSGDEDPDDVAATEALLTRPLPQPDPDPSEDDGDDIVGALDVDVAAPPDLPEASSRGSVGAALPAPPAPPVLRQQLSVVYRPDPKRHMSEMGLVSTANWIGRCRGQRVSVRFGAPLSTIPQCVRVMLAAADIRFGYAPPPAGAGARTVKEAPRARRTERNADKRGDRQKPFRSVKGLHSLP